MKKLILTLVFSLVAVTVSAQSKEVPKLLKYVTRAPNGTISMTIVDDSRANTMKLTSASSFYKYQIIDPKTNQPVLTAWNRGKVCEIAKTKIAAGTYDIRLFTRNFVITSKIKVSATRKLINAMNQDAIAVID